jgi:hypothetical protein
MSCESCGYGAAAPAPLISAATLDEVGRVAREWPDGIHTCEELQAAEPGRRPCTCGRCPSARTPALREISAREITAELRLLYPAPVLLSVRADPDAPNVRLGRQFLVRMPEGPSNHMGGWDGLETYLGRHLSQGIAPYPVRVTGRRTVRRRDYGRSHEYTVVLGRL